MASLSRPFDEQNPTELIRVTRRTTDDLPPHVKDQIQWKDDLPGHSPGYYLYIPDADIIKPLEFIKNFWYPLFVYTGTAFTSLEERIEPHTEGTGYWKLSEPQHPWRQLDPEHPHYSQYAALAEEELQEELRAAAPVLTLATHNLTALSGEPSISPFIATRNVATDDSSSGTATPPGTPEEQEPSPEEVQPDNPVLEAQLQYGLDIQEREPENPLTPNEPAYLQLIEEAVVAGLNVPSPPPLTPQRQQSPAPQPEIMAAPAPTAPVPQTGKLRGETPDIFSGNRKKSETFIRQFNLHLGLNDNHEIMTTPYLRAMYALSLIKGPLVNDWVNDQVVGLRKKVSRVNNPIARTNQALWNDFETAFTNVFTDTAKAQNAHTALEQLTMRGDDLDTYISTFRHLAKDAGYDLNDQAVHHMFGKGLGRNLLYNVLKRETQPTTMVEWEAAARAERQKEARMHAMMHPQKQRYRWVAPQTYNKSYRNGSHRNEPRHHPNDIPVPMDVDTPVFTQVNRAYTEEDKNRHKQEGRCFRCSKRGHMACECPDKKEQPFKLTQHFGKKKPFTPRSKPQGFRKFNKPRTGPQGQIRVASIEEIDSDDEDMDIPSLAARTASLSDEQKEDWLKKLDSYGVHF